MEDEIYVSCHAPCLSLLLFETARSVHDQKGLLIGRICEEVISKKTDENEVNCERKTAIYLEHCIPIDDPETIGNAGSIDKGKLQKYTEYSQNKIVGWYSFRRNSRLVPNSLREMLIHRSLLEHLPDVQYQYFVACFMSSSVAPNMSTHTFNHIFMTYDLNRARFEPIRLKIYTLSDKSVNSNGYSMRNPFPTSSNFNKIINHGQKEETPVKSVLAIHERVSEVLKLIDKKLQSTEIHRLQLEQEVENLKKRLGIVNNEEIVVKEPQREELIVKTIRFNPKVKYNSNRKVNPLNAVVDKPMVPVEKEEKRKPEPRKASCAAVSKSPTSTLPPEPKTDKNREGPSASGSTSPTLQTFSGERPTSPNLHPFPPKSGPPTLKSFTVKPPKNKPGLSPHAMKGNNSLVNNCEVEIVFDANNENSDTKISESNNVQSPKPMEH